MDAVEGEDETKDGQTGHVVVRVTLAGRVAICLQVLAIPLSYTQTRACPDLRSNTTTTTTTVYYHLFSLFLVPSQVNQQPQTLLVSEVSTRRFGTIGIIFRSRNLYCLSLALFISTSSTTQLSAENGFMRTLYAFSPCIDEALIAGVTALCFCCSSPFARFLERLRESACHELRMLRSS